MQEHRHGVIYRAFLAYIQAAERQDPNRDWLERELGAPKDWLAREPEARIADEIAEKHRSRHMQSADGLYDIANPHEVFFCDGCWEESHVRAVAKWADIQARTLCCPAHMLNQQGDPIIVTDDDESDSIFSNYAALFGNEDAANTTFDEEVARRFEILGKLDRSQTEDEHEWAVIDGAYDYRFAVYPFFNPELEGEAYPAPPESVRRVIEGR